MIKKDNLPIYRVTIDEEYQEDEVLGMDTISNVSNPAVQIVGVAFSNQHYKFKSEVDEMKLRIIAPVMVPGDVYRREEEEYYLRFDKEDIEVIAKDFMKNLNKFERVFTDNHTDKPIDSYILEAFIVDSGGKQQMLIDDYNLDVPLGSFVVVQQFNNEEDFEKIVSEGKTGFSLEAYFGKYPIGEFNNLKQKSKMKNKFLATERKLKTASKRKNFEEIAGNESLILIADELKEGEKVEVMLDPADGFEDDFTGEVEVETLEGEEMILIIEDGIIDEVVEEDIIEEEKEEMNEDKEEEEMIEDKEEEDEKMSEDKGIDLNPILDLLLEIKDEIRELKNTDKEEDITTNNEVDKAVFSLMQFKNKKKR